MLSALDEPASRASFAAFRVDAPGTALELVGAHGWGQTHRALLPLAQAVRPRARSVLLDLPGFGDTPPPPEPWGTQDYADAAAAWLQGLAPARRVWLAHSFGCRVGLQLAGRHPEALAGLFLIAAPGLRPYRPPLARLRFAARRWAFRLARQVTPEGPARERLRARFGSADYRAASPLMRQVLVKAVNEDLSTAARAIRVPVVLVYGEQDRDTPPEIGMRLAQLMPQARLVVLRGFGHLDILTEGHHQLVRRLDEFLHQVG